MGSGSIVDFLVVDDDDVFRDRLARSLERHGFTVSKAASVGEAIARLAEVVPKRVIVDLKMPGRSGLELISILRERSSEVEVVVLTGYGSISTTEIALKSGALSYLTKPCSTERILEAFNGPISNRSSQMLPVPSLAQVEWDHINRVIADCDGNITRAAQALGINRRSLQRRLAKSPRVE